jgi:hypothetical protein
MYFFSGRAVTQAIRIILVMMYGAHAPRYPRSGLQNSWCLVNALRIFFVSQKSSSVIPNVNFDTSNKT